MRHVVIDGTHSARLVETDDPGPPDSRGAVVAIEATAICGSDLHFYDGDIPVSAALPVGHEAIGVVQEIGPDVRKVKVGERVLIASVAGCGRCAGCATLDPVRCIDGPQVFGSGMLPGAQADLLAVPAADFQLLPIPDGISDEAALLLTDNLATGWAGAERAGVGRGSTVVVIGLGAVGHCAVRSAFALGAEQVLVADPVEGRRRLAANAGATAIEGSTVAAVMEVTKGRGADVVIDAVALDSTLDDAFNSVRPAGTVSVIGVHDLQPYPLQILLALFKSITLRMTTAPVHQTWPELIPLLQSGAITTDGIFTHVMNLTEATSAYQLVAGRQGDCIKVMMRP